MMAANKIQLVPFLCTLLILGRSSRVRNNTVLDGLYTDLFTGYIPYLPPVNDILKPINVSAYFIIYELISVSEVQNTITFAGSTEFYWRDEFLNWNPGEFGDLGLIYVPANKIWTPKFALYNSSGNNGILQVPSSAEVELISTGDVELAIPFYFNALCTIKVRYFPWDSQHCVLHFGNEHRYNRDVLLGVSPEGIDYDQSTTNQEWHLTSAKLAQKSGVIPDDPNKVYQYLELSIDIKRNPLFYIYTLIIPSFLIAFIAIIAFFAPNNSKVLLNKIVFITQGDRQEKFKIGLSSFTSLLVLQLNVVNRLPRSADAVPIIGLYFTTLLLLISTAIIIATIIMQLEVQGGTVPESLHNIFVDVLPKYLPFVKKQGCKSELVTIPSIIQHFIKTSQSKMTIASGIKLEALKSTRIHSKDMKSEIHELGRIMELIDSKWPQIVKLKEKMEQKERAKADWATFVNCLERVTGLVFLVLLVLLIILLVNPGWY